MVRCLALAALLDPGSFGVDDVLEALLDIVDDTVKLVALEIATARVAQPLEQLLKALESLGVSPAHQTRENIF